MQLCSICEDNDDIVLLKVDWDQNKPIARPLGVKVRNKPTGKAPVDWITTQLYSMYTRLYHCMVCMPSVKLFKGSLQYSKLNLMQSWHVAKADKIMNKHVKYRECLLHVCASGAIFRQFESAANCRFCPFSCFTEVLMDCLHPSQQVCPKYSGSSEVSCSPIPVNALLLLLLLTSPHQKAFGLGANS